MKIKDHNLGAWFNHLLFKKLPPKLYLRTQGIKLYSEPSTTATVTYILHGEEKHHRIKFGSAKAVVQMLPFYQRYGFIETEGEEKYYIPPHDIQKLEWYDPVLKDYFIIY